MSTVIACGLVWILVAMPVSLFIASLIGKSSKEAEKWSLSEFELKQLEVRLGRTPTASDIDCEISDKLGAEV